jgi:hypothetical protein
MAPAGRVATNNSPSRAAAARPTPTRTYGLAQILSIASRISHLEGSVRSADRAAAPAPTRCCTTAYDRRLMSIPSTKPTPSAAAALANGFS